MNKNNSSFKKKLDKIYPLIPSDELVKYSQLFKKELIMALHNQKSSLPTILNPICKIIPEPTSGVAVSIGGTNGYVSSFRLNQKGMVKFLNRNIFVIPKNLTKNELFHLITENILKSVKNKKLDCPIGIGLAYPLKPLLHHNHIDGELMNLTKGRKIEGLVGKKVGLEYHKFLIREYGIDTKVAVANDAICLLLGGKEAEIAGVIGTGLNFAYWEKRTAIAPLKLGELAGFGQGEVAVNIEAGNFDAIEGSFLRKIVDGESDNKGKSLAEKEASGAYIYKIFNTGIKELEIVNFSEINSSDQLNEIYTGSYRYPEGLSLSEKNNVIFLAERIFHRSAQVTAIELCGILLKLGHVKGIVSIVMEGGIFWKAYNYPALVNLYANMILPEIILSFARLFGSSRRGIAILASGS